MNLLSNILIALISFYRFLISPYLGNNCRYIPTCSEYFIDSLKTYGFFKGLYFGCKRMLSCHPFKFLGGSEGFDPVIKNKKVKNNGQ